MRDYELVTIISPEVTAEDLPGAIEKIGQLITSKGGSVTEVDQRGKKKLAYPVKNYREGNYVITKCKLQPQAASELEANLKLAGDVLRHLLVRADE